MGVYDTVYGIQMKCTPEQAMVEYDVGDKIPLEDGGYIGREGIFIVMEGYVAAVALGDLTTKWGTKLSPSKALESADPILEAIRETTKKTV